MRYLAAVIIAILIFAGGFYFGDLQKKCISEVCRTDTVFIPGKTVLVEKPAVKKSYAAVIKNNLTTGVKDSVVNQKLTTEKGTAEYRTLSNPCDSIRTYEYSDSAVTVKDSVQGVLLQQTIIHKPTIREIRTVQVKKDTAVFKSGFYAGASAGLNSIRIEGEYLTKKGWGYSAGYDILNKSPIIGIKRKIF